VSDLKHLQHRLAGSPQSRGRTLLAKHWRNETLTRGEGIAAKCCDCMGYYPDGRIDCRVPACPLYPWMPYRAGIDSEGASGGPSGLRAEEGAESVPDTGSPK
jgi:hypothetical protein